MGNFIIATILGLMIGSQDTNSFNSVLITEHDIYLSQYAQRENIPLSDRENTIHIYGLEEGNEYLIHFKLNNSEAQQDYSLPETPHQVIGHNQKTLQFIAGASQLTIEHTIDREPNDSTLLSVFISDQTYRKNAHKIKYTSRPSLRTPPVITTGIPVSDLITETFIQSSCFDIQNITFQGDADNGVAEFSGTEDLFGFDEGFLMSTFEASVISGPNNSTNDTGPVDNIAGDSDPDLFQASEGFSILDAQVITFTFTPTVEQVSFNYVFASEEYCDFVNSAFNDVFGFFISGPGINGPYSNNAENIALIPGSVTPVSINNVNWETNPDYYISNVPTEQTQQAVGCSTAEINAPAENPNDIIFDGYTTTLTAVADVQPCEEYTIKLAIGDAGDENYGSAVFLEASSFFLGDNIDFALEYNSESGNGVLESCSDDEACLVFTRDAELADLELSIPLSVDPSSVAIEGLDFETLPDTLVFPAGATTFEFCLSVLNDDIIEGIEQAILRIENVCPCDDPLIEINIEDLPPLNAEIDGPENICEGDEVTIGVNVTSGPDPFTYIWNTGDTESSITDSPNETMTYSVTVTDQCGQDTTLEQEVSVVSAPEGEMTGGGNLCVNSDSCVELTFTLTGEGPWDIVYSRNGNNISLNNITTSPHTIDICEPGSYQFEELYDRSCPGTATGAVDIPEFDVNFTGMVTDALCFGDSTGSIDLTITEGLGPFSYEWFPIDSDQEDVGGLPVGEYYVIVTDANGCTNDATFTIDEGDPITITLDDFEPISCAGPNTGAIFITATGGAGGFTYDWSDPAPDVEDPTGIPSANYSLTVTDQNGCTATLDDIFLPIQNEVPTVEAGPDAVLSCTVDQITLLGNASSPSGTPQTLWTTDEGNILTDPEQLNIVIDEAGWYFLLVSNPDGSCPTLDSVLVSYDTLFPQVEITVDTLLTCAINQVEMIAQGNGDFDYSWTTPDGNIASDPNQSQILVDQPGEYTLEALNPLNGCTTQVTEFVEIDTISPSFTIITPDTLDCIMNELWINIQWDENPEYELNWTTPDGSIISDPSADSILVNSSGVYTLTIIKTSNSCQTSQSVSVVDVSETFSVQIEDSPPLTCDSTSRQLDGSDSEMGLNIVPIWLDPNLDTVASGSYTIMANTPGEYTLILRDTITGCQSSTTTELDIFIDSPQLSTALPDTLTCSTTSLLLSASTDLDMDVQEFLWTTSSGNILGNAQQDTIEVNAAGEYIVTLTNTANGCTAMDTVIVLEDSDRPQFQFVDEPYVINCVPSETEISIELDSALDNFVVLWTSSAGNILTDPTELSITVNEPATYYVSIIDQNLGCETVDSVLVQDNREDPNVFVPAIDSLTCRDEVLTIETMNTDPSGDYSYAWTTIGGRILSDISSPDLETDSTGLYILLSINNENGCTSSDTIEIVSDTDEPVILIPEPEVITCRRDTVQIDASGSTGTELSYEWQTSDGEIASASDQSVIAVSSSGIYTVTVTNQNNGCSSIKEVTVFDSLTAPDIAVKETDTLTCQTETIFLSATGSSIGNQYFYQWIGPPGSILAGANTATPEVNQIGTYTLTITDTTNGCFSVADVNVIADDQSPVAVISDAGTLNCITSQINLGTTGSSQGSQFDFSWTQGQMVISNDPLGITVSEPGWYFLNIENMSNGCSAVDSVFIDIDTVSPEIVLDGLNTLTCLTESFEVNFTGSTVSSNTSSTWTLPNGNTATDTEVLTITIPGEYSLLLVDTINGCRDEVSFTIDEDVEEPPVSLADHDVLDCTTDRITLQILNTIDDYEYTWSTDDGNIVSGVNTELIEVDQAGNYIAIITNPANGCRTELSAEVTEDREIPTASIQPTGLLTCIQETLTLDAGESSTGESLVYNWSTPDGSIDDASDPLAIIISEPGIYRLEVRDTSNGCSAMTEIVVDEDRTDPVADFQVNQPECEADFGSIEWTILQGSPPVLASLDGQEFINIQSFNNIPIGNHTVTIRDQTGCSTEYNFSLEEKSAPSLAPLPEDIVIKLGDDYQIDLIITDGLEDVSSISWSPAEGLSCTDCLDPLAMPTSTTLYTVQVSTADDCIAEEQILIIVDESPDIYIPNAFSPNGDGINDAFTVYANENQVARILELSIYDRWGTLVYRSQNSPVNNPELGWNGRFKGEELNPAVFVYVVEVELTNGQIVLREGNVTLTR